MSEYQALMVQSLREEIAFFNMQLLRLVRWSSQRSPSRYMLLLT